MKSHQSGGESGNMRKEHRKIKRKRIEKERNYNKNHFHVVL